MTRHQVATHVYVDDGTSDHQGNGRCRECQTPAGNRRHLVPDLRVETAEHRRRMGEHDDE